MPRRGHDREYQHLGKGVEFREFSNAESAQVHPNQTLPGCLNFSSKPELYRKLKRNAAAEISTLLQTLPTVTTGLAHERARYGICFYTLTQFCFLEQSKPTEPPVILNTNLTKLIFKIVLHAEMYDVWIPDDQSSIDLETADFDAILLGLLYMSLRLFALYLETLVKMQDPAWPRTHWRGIFETGKLLDFATRFWHILWDRRATVFHKRLMRTYVWIPCDEDPVYFSGAVADCLLRIEEVWNQVKRTHDGEKSAIHVLFLSWVYVSGDYERREEIYEEFFKHVQRLTNPNDIRAFRDDCLATPDQEVDYVRALRRNISTRYNEDGAYYSLLEVFSLLIGHPHVSEGMSLWEDGVDHPVAWIMKAIQRQLCMRAGGQLEYGIMCSGFECIFDWSRIMGRNLIEIVHKDLQIPFLPYLGRFALMAVEDRSFQERACRLVKRIASSTARWLRESSLRSIFDPFVRSAAARRAWITTLIELRASEPHELHQLVLASWIKMGEAHGFDESTEAAWLATGENSKPVRRNAPPSDVCGWSGCFCYEHRPLYLLSACTGCQSVFYCGRECQKRDWKEGHRMVCARRKRVKPKEDDSD